MSDRAPLVGDTWCTDPADPTREVRYSHGHVIEVRPISDVQPYTREELDALDDRFDATGEMDELRALATARDTYRLSGTTKFTNVKKTLEIIDRLRATARAAVERGWAHCTCPPNVPLAYTAAGVVVPCPVHSGDPATRVVDDHPPGPPPRPIRNKNLKDWERDVG